MLKNYLVACMLSALILPTWANRSVERDMPSEAVAHLAGVLQNALRQSGTAQNSMLFFGSLKKDGLDISKKTKSFYLKEETRQASDVIPLVYSKSRQLIFDFGENKLITLESHAQKINVVLINGEEFDFNKIQSTSDFKKALFKKFKKTKNEAAFMKFMESLLPSAQAGVGASIGDFLQRNLGLLTIAAGAIVALDGNTALGVGLVAGGLLYELIAKPRESPEAQEKPKAAASHGGE